MDQLLRFALNTFGHFIQDVGRLMDPATLLGFWIALEEEYGSCTL